MPTVLRRGPYRFFFYSGDRTESPHVHVERDRHIAKIWLEPLRLADAAGFADTELRRILLIAQQERSRLLGSWNEHFGL